MKGFYVTTAIDYVNSKPHLGHAYEKIVTDIVARWHRLGGEDVFFLTGTDENGQKVARAARKKGRNVKEFVDEMAKNFTELCKKLNISYDDFIRTTEKRHIKVAQQIFQKMFKSGDIYKGKYEGLYCYDCESFYLEKDLKNGRCPIHDKPVEILKEESYFFRMSKYQKRLLKHLERRKDFILPSNRRDEIINRVKKGLKDLSVSRSGIDWGVPVSFDNKHRIYVWMDALENYISALGYPNGERFKKFWPCDYHFIGIDINWFHSVIWPCMLMSIGVDLPKHIFVHGFINIKGKKMSKSKGTGVDPITMVNKYGVDGLRYFLAREIPLGQDGDFSEDSLKNRINNELVANYGNLFYRVTSFIERYFSGRIPKPGKAGSLEKSLKMELKKTFEESKKHMKELSIDKALGSIMSLSSKTNKYFQHKKPWESIKTNENDASTTMYYSVNIVGSISVLLLPFMPETCRKATEALGIKNIVLEKAKDFMLKPNHEVKAKFLFKKII